MSGRWIVACGWLVSAAALHADEPLLGRWNLTVHAKAGDHPSWLEVRKSGRKTLVGSFVGQFGSARPVGKIEFADGKLRFTIPPQWERRETDLVFEGRLDGELLHGETNDDRGRTVKWEGRRAPTLARAGEPQWGEPVALFDGKTLTGWKPRDPKTPNGWTVTNGVLSNAKPGNDLVTESSFRDFVLNLEYRYPKGSNSGVYLRGRYEVQIEDNFGDEPECHKVGGVYGFLTPSVNAAKPAGEWQTMEVKLVGRQVTVTLNGERIVDRQAIPGPTGGALDNREAEPGPIMLQGDHGPVEFRKVVLIRGKE